MNTSIRTLLLNTPPAAGPVNPRAVKDADWSASLTEYRRGLEAAPGRESSLPCDKQEE
jgi:hypothetical protein